MSRRGRSFVLLLVGGAVLALKGQHPVRPCLIWNATASAPIGLYAVQPDPRPKVGELVVVRPDPRLARWMVERGYIGRDVALVKRVAAVAGAHVCRSGLQVSINGRHAATALARDHLGRALPAWTGCETLGPGQLLVLNAAPASLDGRYFGPTPVAAVVGRALPILAPARR